MTIGPPQPGPSASGSPRSHPFVRRVALAWRRLTNGGSPTFVACSGGADSVALLLALSATTRDLAAAFIIHDLRPREQEVADAEFVQSLCATLGVPFMMGEVTSEGGNQEGVSRDRRYAMLAQMAEQRAMPFVATGHHADDQLETLVMALLRGSGPAGLRGVAPSRLLAPGVTLIRPLLTLSRAQCQGFCRDAGVAWREDWTNADTRRLRAALRAGPLADLVSLRPASPARAARTAALMRDAAQIIDQRVRAVAGDAHQWDRAALRAQPALIVGGVLRAGAMRLTQGAGLDALGDRVLDPAIRAIRGGGTEPRVFHWPAGLTLRVTSRHVWLERAEPD